MPKKVGNSAIDRHNKRASEYARSQRQMGPEGAGSSGDLRDRFRDVYKPNARKPPLKPGPMSPGESIKRIGDMFKKRRKSYGPKPV